MRTQFDSNQEYTHKRFIYNGGTFDAVTRNGTNEVMITQTAMALLCDVSSKTISRRLGNWDYRYVSLQVQVPKILAKSGWKKLHLYKVPVIAALLKAYSHPWAVDEENVQRELIDLINRNSTAPSTVPSTVPITAPSTSPIDVVEANPDDRLNSDEMVYDPIEFNFNGCVVRLIRISLSQEEIIGGDLVRAADPEVPQSSIPGYLRKVREEYKGVRLVHTPGGIQRVATLKQPGWYEYFIKAQSPNTEPFQRWLFEDVLPTIHKTGSYSVADNISTDSLSQPRSQAELALEQCQSVTALAEAVVGLENRIMAVERQNVQIERRRNSAEQELLFLPACPNDPPPFTARQKVVELVKNKAARDSLEFKMLYRTLYKHYGIRCSVNLKARCKKNGLSYLDQIELDGGMEKLWAIATELFTPGVEQLELPINNSQGKP